jgi:tRNA(Leu) C34 or U34 (ribose-2'-O)-methylase TrmL
MVHLLAENKRGSMIGLVNPKSPSNIGMIMRAAGCYEADEVFYSGNRYDRARKFNTDTQNSASTIYLSHTDNILNEVPKSFSLVGVELVEGAIPLMDFQHPDEAFYLFGPEDGSLTQEQVDACDYVVYIPTIGCMNLACTVNVLLYDRLAKSGTQVINDRPINENKDRNNQTRVKE